MKKIFKWIVVMGILCASLAALSLFESAGIRRQALNLESAPVSAETLPEVSSEILVQETEAEAEVEALPEIIIEEILPEEEAVPAPEEIIIPLELSIESIGVHAPIESVGVLNGAMAVPELPEYVGWYKFGTIPGQIGSAVLAGHVNWRNSPDAVFMNLKKVQVGDTIIVMNSNGEVISFLVDNIKSYPLYSDSSEVFSSDDGLVHLNLITCGGLWNSIINSHEERLVIFSTKIDTDPEIETEDTNENENENENEGEAGREAGVVSD